MSRVFKNNPIKLKQYVEKLVKIQTCDGETHEGTLYTIDPVTESIVLVRSVDRAPSLRLIFHHSVKSLSLIGDSEPLSLFDKKEASRGDLAGVRAQLKTWLERNMLTVEEIGETLQLAGQLVINPPYTRADCMSTNEIVLKRVQHLIDAMPLS